jgi:hypothetical protein
MSKFIKWTFGFVLVVLVAMGIIMPILASKMASAPAPVASEPDIAVLSAYASQPYTQMVEELGPPNDKTGYTIEKAPTKTWNHSELFSLYPKNDKNKDIQIMEVTWDAGDHHILACYHMVDGVNRCIVAKRIKKGMQF